MSRHLKQINWPKWILVGGVLVISSLPWSLALAEPPPPPERRSFTQRLGESMFRVGRAIERLGEDGSDQQAWHDDDLREVPRQPHGPWVPPPPPVSREPYMIPPPPPLPPSSVVSVEPGEFRGRRPPPARVQEQESRERFRPGTPRNQAIPYSLPPDTQNGSYREPLPPVIPAPPDQQSTQTRGGTDTSDTHSQKDNTQQGGASNTQDGKDLMQSERRQERPSPSDNTGRAVPNSSPETPATQANRDLKANVEYGISISDRPGFVYPPGVKQELGNMLDVRGMSPGQKVRDPRSGKIFLVP